MGRTGTLDEMKMYQTNMWSWIFIVLAHWNNSQWVDMSLYSDTLFWFWAKQSLLLLLSGACLADKQQFYRLWSDQTNTETHNLSHWKWACQWWKCDDY